jgi:hypothetical protein
MEAGQALVLVAKMAVAVEELQMAQPEMALRQEEMGQGALLELEAEVSFQEEDILAMVLLH